MKKVLLFILLFSSLAVFSQKNAVKLGLLSIEYGDFTIGYERVINSKSSLNFNMGYWDLKTGSIDLYRYSTEGKGVWLTGLGHGIHTSLEYRFYVGEKGAMSGFYVAPYLRFWNQSFTFEDIIKNSKVNNVHFSVPTKMASLGLGFQMGYHWQIYKNVSVDWYFVGVGIEKFKLDATYTAVGVKNFNYSSIEADVKEVFSNVKYFGKNLTTEATSDGLKIKLPLWLPGVRSGFTIGYAF